MRILILNDLHHQNEEFMFLYQNKFLENIIFLIDKEAITHVFILGDLIDNKKIIDINTANKFKELYRKISKKCKLYVLMGNHDIYFYSKNDINSPSLIIENNLIINEPIKIENCILVPWINENNAEKIKKFVSENNKEENYLFGHFVLRGFNMNKNKISKESQIYRPDYDKYKKVFSGHFHIRQEKNNVLYTGSPYQLNFGEIEEKGVHILDTETGEIKFIKNKNDIFLNIYINENSELTILKEITNKKVKLYIDSTDQNFINNVEMEVEKYRPYKYLTNFKDIDIEEIEDEEQINNIEEDLNNDFLKSLKYDSSKEKEIINRIFNSTFDIIKNGANYDY